MLLLITLLIFILKIKKVNGVVFFDDNSHLDYLYQKLSLSENVIAKIDIEIEIELQKGGELSQEVKREELEQRNVQLKNHLQHRRFKKWNKIKDELHKENKTKESITSTSKQKEGAIRDEDQENNKTVNLLKESQRNNPILINQTIDCNLVNGLCVDNVTDNRRYRKKHQKLMLK